jgi:hypothetical protein
VGLPVVKLRLIDDWKTELHRLWSARFGVYLFVLTQVLAFLPSVADQLNPRFLLVVFGVAIAGIVFLRFVKQVDPEQ